MAGNHLENLVAEWFEYQGFFVRQNVLVGPRPNGGYEGELDVVAFHPGRRELVHIEPSLDADTWKRREERYSRKFELGRRHIPRLFDGLPVPEEIDQIALLVFASKTNHASLGGGRIMLVDELLEEILRALRTKSVARAAVPEHLPNLRTLQFVASYPDAMVRGLGGEK